MLADGAYHAPYSITRIGCLNRQSTSAADYRMRLTLIGQGDAVEVRGHGMWTVLNWVNIAVGGILIPKMPSRMQAYVMDGLISGVCYVLAVLILWAL
ncbi:MAG: hypothetical protein HND46_24115 [Chloroflexi bacterium]|nr:hypothetical protein [Chloroflexota bacterium]NOG66503.1 hypothetical protein [Chloroflexota bacterium]